jgi:hypothetical protein
MSGPEGISSAADLESPSKSELYSDAGRSSSKSRAGGGGEEEEDDDDDAEVGTGEGLKPLRRFGLTQTVPPRGSLSFFRGEPDFFADPFLD